MALDHGVAGKGQDERAMHLARAEHYSALSKAGDPDRRFNATEQDFNAGYRAALVESEARERELGAKIRALEAMWDVLKAREAVLVEALREAETALDEINVQAHSTASRWIRNRSFDALAKLRAALAGVVEAEPDAEFAGHDSHWAGADRRRGERRTGTRWPYGQASDLPERRIGPDRRRAEPDGGTDDR